jgi:hypothetical protein
MPTEEAVIVGLAAFFLLVGFIALWRITRDKTRRWTRVRIGVFVERDDEPDDTPRPRPPGPSQPPAGPGDG